MKKIKIILFIFFIIVKTGFSQINVYQDVFKGGVTGDAFAPWNLPFGGDFEIYIEPNSTIRKAYLFVTVYFSPDENILYINNNPVVLNAQDTFNNEYLYIDGTDIRRMKTLMIDVTHIINPTQNIYPVSALIQPSTLSLGFFTYFYLYVAYENTLMQDVCANVFVNNVQPSSNMLFSFGNLNPIDVIQNVGLALNSGEMCDTIKDGSFVKIDNTLLGLIGGQDDGGLSICDGVSGSFYYQNGALFGLGNDIANSTMSGTDAIANIESYLNSSTAFDLTFDYQSTLGSKTNPIHQLFLTYTTTCAPFDVTVTNDTIICKGEQLQLMATSANPNATFEWSAPTGGTSGNPAPGLSCTNCPNPVFSGDSSMFYTVRIWNNDSCSVVRPVHILVKEPPVLPLLTIAKAVCGTASGSVLIQKPQETGVLYLISENGDTLTKPLNKGQNALQGGLFGGNYTVYFQDSLGCRSGDSSFVIPTINNTVAGFTVSPQAGGAPLEVVINNTSVQAQNYSWYVNGALQNNPFTNFVADTSGTYQIMLVAWQNDSACADTAYATVNVYDSLIVHIPNVFTPNNDGVNDSFGIHTNLPIHAQLNILNRWGEVVYNFQGNLTPGFNPLWNTPATDGVYFYEVVFTLDDTIVNCQLQNCRLTKEGFITVVR